MPVRLLSFVLTVLIALTLSQPAQAFCGFFVAKADTNLFNDASKVITSRKDERTVITMANDFRGDLSEFSIVIPVPTVITESQVNVTENRIVDHLDAYTAPRLVEYYDSNPCQQMFMEKAMRGAAAPMAMMAMDSVEQSAEALGVTIEAEYTVGEYDIQILSAEQSDGLLTWLNQEGYKMPQGAARILGSYIKQDMKFFVAKVNLDEQAKTDGGFLSPLQVAYESEKFMLPIRLGTLNADGKQELILMTLSSKGRVEPTNYRQVKLPTGMDVPLFVKDEFGEFYKAMFYEQAAKEDHRVVFLEYAWDMGWCDPCAADPLANDDLRTLGAYWIQQPPQYGGPRPMRGQRAIIAPQPRPQNVFVTRMHVRYDGKSFPEDIVLQETEDRQNFQGRYVMRHPWTGEASCDAAESYYQSLPKRFEKEAKTLANLTGWDISDIRDKMEQGGQSFSMTPMKDEREWWEKLWDKTETEKQ